MKKKFKISKNLNGETIMKILLFLNNGKFECLNHNLC